MIFSFIYRSGILINTEVIVLLLQNFRRSMKLTKVMLMYDKHEGPLSLCDNMFITSSESGKINLWFVVLLQDYWS